MSQLVKAIMATDTGERKLIQDSFSPLFQDVFSRKESFASHDMCAAKTYKIGITLGNQCTVSELDTLANEDALSLAVERTKRGVVEAVFGEFREDFYRLETAIYDRDFQKARSLLTIFQRKMYEVE